MRVNTRPSYLERTIVQVFVALLGAYQRFFSPWLGANCRYYPVCSEYAKEAFSTHGFSYGLRLSLSRVLRCNSLCEGGFDPVKERKSTRA